MKEDARVCFDVMAGDWVARSARTTRVSVGEVLARRPRVTINLQRQIVARGCKPWMNGSMAEAVVRLKRCTRPGARHGFISWGQGGREDRIL
jgi:hypothetical protein